MAEPPTSIAYAARPETQALAPRRSSDLKPARRSPMTVTIESLQPIVALAAGIGILIVPRLLNYIVAAYLILSGLIGLGVIAV